MPARDELGHAVLNSIGQGSLRTSIEINFALEDLEPGADLANFFVGEHKRLISASALPNSRTAFRVL
jgi:hypothetical protein